ncbi:MAG: Rrf2 family transcriptional regulator [Armatimonadetes bacterium]|nr:Rrf2 family transcriptional regulator [Armatimonadota bacterium]
MEISSQAHMALRVVLDLAIHDQARIKEISRRQGIPLAYAAKIVQALARGGIVTTSRGVHGGVRLARPAARTTLRQVIEAVEGPVAFNRCVRWEQCACEQPCPVRLVLSLLQNTVINFLDSITLDTMAPARPASPERPVRGGSAPGLPSVVDAPAAPSPGTV